MNSAARHLGVARRALIAAGALAAIAGCAPRADDTGGNSTAVATDISLRVTGVDGYRETLAGLRGKVVFVDFWATWCAPCMEQFPHTVELFREHHDRGLAVIGVSLNQPNDEPQVRDFLTRQEARFDNLLSEYHSSVEAVDAFGLPGPVPCYRVYDRSGTLRREFAIDPRAERQFTPEDIESAVVELL